MESNNGNISNGDFVVSDRMKLLQSVLYKTVDDIAEGVSREEFITALGELSSLSNKPKSVDKIRSKINLVFVSDVTEHVKDIFHEENLDKKFEDLTILTKKNSSNEGQKAWRPPGNVEKHLHSPTVTEKLKQIGKLKQFVEEKEKSVEYLSEEVVKRRQKVAQQIESLGKLEKTAMNSMENSEILLCSLKPHES